MKKGRKKILKRNCSAMFRGSTLIYPIAKYPRENKLYFTALSVLINSTYKNKVSVHKK